jgi:hypothetical protein
MPPRVFVATTILVLCSLALPSASAWTLPNEKLDSITPRYSAWTIDLLGGLPQGEQLPIDAFGAATCPLGDVDADGVDDILVRVKETSSGPPSLKALSGPTFVNASWKIATSGDRVLQCAPDLDADGVFDPVTALVSQGSQSASGSQAVANDAQEKAMQVISGASGMNLINRVHQDTKQGTEQASASGGVKAASEVTANLMPAVQGAEAFVKTELQQTALSAVGGGLPVDGLTATARHTATMQLLDVQGSVEGTIALDQPGVDPLALAPLPVGGGLPQVSALTAQTISPVKEAASQVPTLSLYNPDGTLAWATQLAPGPGLPVLVPRAGDLNVDGVQDIIVENVPTDVSASATGQFQVLSGLDGSQLLDSGAAVNGLAAALPLGELSSGVPGILSIEHVTGAAEMTVSVLDGAGAVLWTLPVSPDAIPVNVRPDAYTGDPLGFTDLTGDGLADLGLAVPTADGLELQSIDGVTGKVAWTSKLAGMASVVPLSTVADLGQLSSATPNLPTDLLAVGLPTNGPALTLIDGVSGEVVWSLAGELPQGAAAAQFGIQAAGDLNADGVQDFVATLSSLASAPPIPGGAERDAQEEPEVDGQAVYAISGHDGSTIWSNATDVDNKEAAVELQSQEGPAYDERAEALEAEQEKGGRSPSLGAIGIAVVAMAAAWLRSRREQ